MWENCGYTDDWLAAALLPWEWVTAGNFTLVLVSLFAMMSYIKYHKATYPLIIGVIMLPVSYFVFPEEFLSFAILAAFVTVGILVWYIFVRQTKDF